MKKEEGRRKKEEGRRKNDCMELLIRHWHTKFYFRIRSKKQNRTSE
jgi:hypothetical protein